MKLTPKVPVFKILLADDDIDDQAFFAKALKQVPLETELITVTNGEELMKYLLANAASLPALLFLDLSMPSKTGFECLSEIKENIQLNGIRVIILSTSYSRDISYEKDLGEMLFGIGAFDYIRKPGDIKQLTQNIHNAILNARSTPPKTPLETK